MAAVVARIGSILAIFELAWDSNYSRMHVHCLLCLVTLYGLVLASMLVENRSLEGNHKMHK